MPDPVATLLRAYPVLHHALRQRAIATAGDDVSGHQATILAHLDPADGRTVTELARLLEVSVPTMSLMIGRLVDRGLVRRERDPADGRRATLTLEPAGVEVVARRSLLDPDRVRDLLGRLTPAERAAGVSGISTLARAVERFHLDGAPGAPSEDQ